MKKLSGDWDGTLWLPGSDNKLSCYESLPTSPYNCREDRPDLIIAWHTDSNYGQNYAKLVSQNKLICLQPSLGHLGRGHFPQLTNNKQTEREGERERRIWRQQPLYSGRSPHYNFTTIWTWKHTGRFMFSNVSKLDIFIPVEALWLKISFKLSPGKIHAVSLTWRGEERKVLTFSELISASIICKQIIRNLSWWLYIMGLR